MSFQYVVTTFDNIDPETNQLIDKSLKGYISKEETIQEPQYAPEVDENGQIIGEKHVGNQMRVVCHVIWIGKAPFHPAIVPYFADQLVILGQENSISDLIETVNELIERVATLEAMISDDDDEDEDDDDDEDFEENGGLDLIGATVARS